MKVLIIEDDNDINLLLGKILEEENYEVTSAYTGIEGKLFTDVEDFDLILLDLMLPGMSGEEIIEYIRKKERKMPILVISAKIDKATKLKVLKNGADDFIIKPFDIDEVMARVEANLRRYKEFSNSNIIHDVLHYKELEMNIEEIKIKVKGEEINLTPIEFEILKLLLSHPKKTFTKENIYKSVWKDEFYGDENTANVHISNLRNKISRIDSENEYIKTIWGMGFRIG
ncbi:response regulator transcription factor [Hathewaya histolytica]|uniref:Stage 0 sporulation protein A homolog n=1 Tax=Hathewaya histolytica TaxID=1498 RepID=A0A4U9R406_HATHI|nr:response regulator transcription factor [Hathewaya histolytica]VTQ85348.1 winged helix family two component transcriptional regulator [Hathewaya histolytica]